MVKQHLSQHKELKRLAYQLREERSKYYQKIEVDFLNNRQNFLYHRALFGLSMYKQEEIVAMSKAKRKRIIRVQKRAQKILNIWKQQRLIHMTNTFFKTIFPDAPLAKDIVNSVEVDEGFKCTLSFKALGISKNMIVKKFLEEKILPVDFYEIKEEAL